MKSRINVFTKKYGILCLKKILLTLGIGITKKMMGRRVSGRPRKRWLNDVEDLRVRDWRRVC